MTEFNESMRYEYDLAPESLVVDVGAHMGDFSRNITSRYNCSVIGFEPILTFWKQATRQQTNKVWIFHAALGGWDDVRVFGVAGDWSGQFVANQPNAETVTVMDACCLRTLCPNGIDLLKINIEGGEYEVLNRLIECDMIAKCRNIQVQFHTCVGDYESKRTSIVMELAKTHHLEYCYPYIWESWKRK